MIRSTKCCLKKVIGRACFSIDELTTALAEIEAVLNSRPLSYVSGEDREEPITPSHLVVGHRILSLPDNLDYTCDIGDEEFMIDSGQVTKRVKHLNNVINHFWKRWRMEYLSCLRESHAHLSKRSKFNDSQISEGEVVIVKDDHLPRGQWRLGIVQEVMMSCDGLKRAATIKIVSSNRQHTTLRRPVQLLYPLEILCKSTETFASETRPESVSAKKTVNLEERTRPKRAAARRAKDLIQNLVEDDFVDEIKEDD